MIDDSEILHYAVHRSVKEFKALQDHASELKQLLVHIAEGIEDADEELAVYILLELKQAEERYKTCLDSLQWDRKT